MGLVLAADHGGGISVSPGRYEICWCSGFAREIEQCRVPEHFRVLAARLVVQGPMGGHDLFCNVGQPCSFSDVNRVTGTMLQASDRMTVLVRCGMNSPIPGLPGMGREEGTGILVTDENE